jgi:hypothetical protein
VKKVVYIILYVSVFPGLANTILCRV